MSQFISYEFENTINQDVVDQFLPNLIDEQKKFISHLLINILEVIALCWFIDVDPTLYIERLQQNNYRDIKWLLTLLFPYTTSFDMTNLSQLYHEKYAEVDINITEPKYIYSNLQYNRYTKQTGTYKEIDYQPEHFIQNYYLLIDTIKKSRYKLHINWIDIIPYRLDDYRESTLFKQTVEQFNAGHLFDWDPHEDFPHEGYLDSTIKGLNLEDIYNTLSVDLYDQIVNYKWLLFDIGVTIKGIPSIFPLIFVLDAMLTIPKECFTGADWETDLTDSYKQYFSMYWKQLVTAFKEQEPIAVIDQITANQMILNQETVQIFVKAIVTFFDTQYTKIGSIRKGPNPYIPIKKEIDIDEFGEADVDIDSTDILPSVLSIQPHSLYDFLKESLMGFRATWYALHLLNPEKTEIVGTRARGFWLGDDIYLTYKNIYNFCKSLTHYSVGNEFVRYAKYWAELTSNQPGSTDERSIIISRLDNKGDPILWFNITGNLYNVLKSINPNIGPKSFIKRQLEDVNKNLHTAIMQILPDLIFETMISRGVMSRFVPNNRLTNSNLFDISKADSKQELIDQLNQTMFYPGNPFEYNSFYFMNNLPYELVPKYAIEKSSQPVGYFDIQRMAKYAWYLAPAYNWVAQIGFCHRFVHTRITFITGGTGSGKSTQVPKLFCYYLKAIDHINDPTIVITVPRTSAATEISEFVSKEMALPYEHFIGTDKRHTKLFSVQYRYMGNIAHIKDGRFPKIRFITDGTVLQNGKDPFLKKKKVVETKQVYEYKIDRDNIYDVVIIDEAHEHNANMDMILTIMKNCALYNNKLHLVIVSATMEADEHIYRRFYRDINDNLKYPLDSWIQMNKLDRINVDRRYHIQPPEQIATRFPITEYYMPNADPDAVVKQIVSQSLSGDILFFQPGANDINKSVTKLNSAGFLPEDTIAIPYYKKMGKNYDFVKSIATNFASVRLPKTSEFTESDPTVGDNKYRRFVLVATNIAEASVTIDSLRYIVDTGIEKALVFDYNTRSNVLQTSPITEASRVQRKGRIGRTASGTAYYLYPKGSLEKVTKQYNISIQDISFTIMYDFFKDEEKPVFNPTINQIINGRVQTADTKRTLWKTYTDDDNLITNILMGKKVRSKQPIKQIQSIIDIIVNQYTVHGNFYTYYGDETHNVSEYIDIYFSGYNSEQLIDRTGKFYIIHPDELYLVRNIGGDITSVLPNGGVTLQSRTTSAVKSIESKKIMVFWQMLRNQLFLKEEQGFTKTNFGKFIHATMQTSNILEDETLMKLLGFTIAIYDYRSKEFYDMLNFVAMFKTVDQMINNLATKTSQGFSDTRRLMEFAKSMNLTSDVQLFVTIANIFDSIGLANFMKSHYITDFGLYGILTGPANGVDFTENNLNSRTIALEEIIKLDINEAIDRVDAKISLLMSIGVDHLVARNFFILRETLRKQINDQMIDITKDTKMKPYDENKVYQQTKLLQTYIGKLEISPIDSIILFTMPYNLLRKIDQTNIYMSLYNPNLRYSVENRVSYYSKKIEFMTAVQKMRLSEYIVYLTNRQIIESDITIVSNVVWVSVDWLKLIINMFDLKEITRKQSMPVVLSNWTSDKLYSINNKSTFNSVMIDLDHAQNSEIWNIRQHID